jgi:hypothetical protein
MDPARRSLARRLGVRPDRNSHQEYGCDRWPLRWPLVRGTPCPTIASRLRFDLFASPAGYRGKEPSERTINIDEGPSGRRQLSSRLSKLIDAASHRLARPCQWRIKDIVRSANHTLPSRQTGFSFLLVRIEALVAAIGFAVSTTSSALARRPFIRRPNRTLPGEPGTLVRQQTMAGAPLGAAAYGVLYRSTDFNGKPLLVSGVMIVPRGPPSGGPTIVAWAHPTSGIVPRHTPSLAIFMFQQVQDYAAVLCEAGSKVWMLFLTGVLHARAGRAAARQSTGWMRGSPGSCAPSGHGAQRDPASAAGRNRGGARRLRPQPQGLPPRQGEHPP